MKIENFKGFEIHESDGHGQNVKGNKKTSSIQVRQYMSQGYLLLASFRFKVGDLTSREKAIYKAKQYIVEY